VITKAIDYFDLAQAFGDGSLERAFQRASARFLVMSFSSDWLYPPHQSAAIVSAAAVNGLDVEYHNLRSSYGHDAFLLEEARQTRFIRAFLQRVAAER
jgi:homoserine O-acetyltransferase